MKINGKKISGPNIEVIVIPRADGDIPFRAQAVLDYADFDKLYPMPQPPQVLMRGGAIRHDTEDKKYHKSLDEWAQAKTHYMVLRSLEATDGLEWETVKMSDPKTWPNYAKEMTESGFTPTEVGRIIECVTNACGLNQKKIDEATERFLAGQGLAHGNGSSPSIVPKNTPSGEPANASASSQSA